MEETIRQLGGLLLGSVPTVFLLLLLYALYTVIVHKPLVRVLAERRAKTEGAVEKARADIAAAEARTAEYEQRLREARAAIFKAQEARRQQAMNARTAAVADARAKAQKQVEQARAGIQKDKADAQTALTAEAGKLATAIIQTVLRPAAAGGGR
jgi:F-type H+-transporting ATPase subunit b